MANPKFVKGHQHGFTAGHQKGFTKGASGNPGGRPRIPQEVKDAARGLSLEAIETLAKWMRQDDNGSAAIAASNSLLDRAWGKPVQSVEVGKPGAFDELTDDELGQRIRSLIPRAEARVGDAAGGAGTSNGQAGAIPARRTH